MDTYSCSGNYLSRQSILQTPPAAPPFHVESSRLCIRHRHQPRPSVLPPVVHRTSTMGDVVVYTTTPPAQHELLPADVPYGVSASPVTWPFHPISGHSRCRLRHRGTHGGIESGNVRRGIARPPGGKVIARAPRPATSSAVAPFVPVQSSPVRCKKSPNTTSVPHP